MKDEKSPKLSGQAEQIYNRMLQRVEKALVAAEDKTWETLTTEIDKAVEFEMELGEATRDELSLLAAYLRRDLQHLVQFFGSGDEEETLGDWLRLDLSLVEKQLADMLLSIADKTQVETLELDQKIHHAPDQYLSGEIATAGVLRCLDCGEPVALTVTTRIEPCHHCGSHYFERITARSPAPDNAAS